jgi:hypothetical protein
MERCGPRMQLRSHIHTPEITGECEGMNPHTPKWVPTFGVRVLMHIQVLREQLERSKFIGLKKYSYHWKALKI